MYWHVRCWVAPIDTGLCVTDSRSCRAGWRQRQAHSSDPTNSGLLDQRLVCSLLVLVRADKNVLPHLTLQLMPVNYLLLHN